MRNLWYLIIFYLLSHCANADAELAEELKCLDAALSESIEKRDLSLFRSFIDKDARFIGGDVLHGIDPILKRWSVFFKKDGAKMRWRSQFSEVLADGKVGMTRGVYHLRMKNEQGENLEDYGAYHLVWRRNSEGEWRVVFNTGNASADTPDGVESLFEEVLDCPKLSKEAN